MGALVKAGIRITLAYTAAAFSASFVSIVLVLTLAGLSTAFRSVGSVPTLGSIYLGFSLAVVIAVVATPIAGLASFIPILLAQTVAEKFSIGNPWYYIVAGAITGLLLSPFAMYLVTGGQGFENPELVAASACAIAPGGAIGGFVYWMIDGRYLAGETRLTPPAF